MSAEFIQMISDWYERKYSVPNIAASNIPCGFFVAPVATPEAEKYIDQFFKANRLNLTCVCFMSQEDKESFRPIDGIKFVTLKEFPTLEAKPRYMFVMRGFFQMMFADFFKAYGVDMLGYNDKGLHEEFYDIYMHHLPQLYETHKLLADDESKKVFRAFLTGHVTALIKDYRYAPEPQYFLEGFLPSEGEIAIDGGAYDGATALDFAKQGAKVYAFEMSASNYKNCIDRITASGGGDIVLENLGLSNLESETEYIDYGHDNVGSRKASNGEFWYQFDNPDDYSRLTAKFIDLDTYVERNKLPRVDYIKLDIEGAELEMLHGAAKTISRWKPKLAISAYHKPEDLWTLAAYIKSLRSDYEFKFRHYLSDCTDMHLNNAERVLLRKLGMVYLCPSWNEAVLYCK